MYYVLTKSEGETNVSGKFVDHGSAVPKVGDYIRFYSSGL